MKKSNFFKEAHRLTREIKSIYPEVDYRAEFGLILRMLHKEAKKVVKQAVLKTTNKIKNILNNTKKVIERIIPVDNKTKILDNYKFLLCTNVKNNIVNI